jgi:hypothetical protein
MKPRIFWEIIKSVISLWKEINVIKKESFSSTLDSVFESPESATGKVFSNSL